jgi:hypothetical protein
METPTPGTGSPDESTTVIATLATGTTKLTVVGALTVNAVWP